MPVSVSQERTRKSGSHPGANRAASVPHRSGAHLRHRQGCSASWCPTSSAWSSICSSPTSPCPYSAGSMLLALVCSSAIGIVFGFMPARNSSASTLSTRFRGNDERHTIVRRPARPRARRLCQLPDGQPENGSASGGGRRRQLQPEHRMVEGYHVTDLDRIVALALGGTSDLA